MAIVADGGGRHLRCRSTPNGLEILRSTPVGEPPGQPRIVSRQTQYPAGRVGGEAPWKDSIELLGGPDWTLALLAFEFGKALDHSMVKELEPLGRSWDSVLRAESNPDWPGLWPGEKNGP